AGLFFLALPQSHEGFSFDALYMCGTIAVYALVLGTLVRQVELWRQLRDVLDRLAWYPLMAAFRRLPRGTFKSRFTAEAPELADLGPLVHRMSMSRRVHVAMSGVSQEELDEALKRQPDYVDLNSVFDADRRTHTWAAWREGRTWEAIQKLLVPSVRELRKY